MLAHGGTNTEKETHMKVQPIPANGEKACDCCGRFHRKLYFLDGYWMGQTCAEDYTLYKRNADITSLYWRGYEKKHAKVRRMLHGASWARRKEDPMQRTQKVSPEQQAYMEAKVQYQEACAVHTAVLTRLGYFELPDETPWETFAAMDDQAEAESQHDAAFATLRQAKEALFVWGHKQAMNAARRYGRSQESMNDIMRMFDTIYQYPHLEDKLTDICLRLRATR
jgi:hypothetical protein